MYDYSMQCTSIDNLWICMREWTNIIYSTQNKDKSQDNNKDINNKYLIKHHNE
jgi:hypothetical protein